MTKVIILGESTPEKPKKPIEFEKFLTSDLSINHTDNNPKAYNNIELICRKYNIKFDLMYAYDDDRNEGILFIGQFNDGVVE